MAAAAAARWTGNPSGEGWSGAEPPPPSTWTGSMCRWRYITGSCPSGRIHCELFGLPRMHLSPLTAATPGWTREPGSAGRGGGGLVLGLNADVTPHRRRLSWPLAATTWTLSLASLPPPG